MNESRKHVIVELNCVAKRMPVDHWETAISVTDDPQLLARNTLVGGFYEEREGHLVPLVQCGADCLVPDEIIVREMGGKILARWNIVGEKNARSLSSPPPL
jgi:hypothetical protein